MRLLVALETHFARDARGHIVSRFGTDGYPFWRRYLEVFDEVLIAARTADDAAPSAGALAVEGPGVAVVALPEYHAAWGYLRARTRLLETLAAAVREADVLCLRAPGPIAAAAARLRDGRPFGVEVVGDPRDALAAGAVRSVVRPLARVALARNLRVLCRDAVAVAYVTERTLQRRYPTRAWSTAYSSIDLDADAFVDDEKLRRRWLPLAGGRAPTPWRLLSVGSLAQPYKGHDVLLDAVARVRASGLALELTIAGDGRLRPALERQARARGLAEVVRFAGHLGCAELRLLLDRAHLFVLPSRTEGLPRALIEAMARGLPGLGTRVGGVPELLPEERLVPAGDAAALARALRRLCRPATDFAALARRDYAVARRHAADVLRPRRVAFYRRLRAAA